MINYNSEFLDLYEELSQLNEAVPKYPSVYIKDLVGYRNGHPILKSDNDPNHTQSLFDLGLIDIEGSKQLNKDRTHTRKDNGKVKVIPLDLPEDPNTWVIDSSDKSRARLVIKCSNPKCRHGGKYTPTLKQLKERIWAADEKAVKAWCSYADEQSIEDIGLCPGCAEDRMRTKKNLTAGKTDFWGSYRMSDIGGFDDDDNIIQATAVDNSILKYLNVPASLELNPDLEYLDPKHWPAFEEGRTFYYNCPECGLPDTLAGRTLRIRSSTKKSITDLLKCNVCSDSRKQADEGFGVSIARDPVIWERVADWMFEDKSLGEDAILTRKGYEFLLANNKECDSNKTFLQNLPFAFDKNSNSISKIKAAKHFTKESELKLPFVCTNQDCRTKNGGKAYEYISTPHLVNKGKLAYLGCDNCITAGKGRQHSLAEDFLKDSVALLFGVKPIEGNDQPKIKPYHEIDILFKATSGQYFGIEYDGCKFHKDPKTILADEAKVQLFNTQEGITFMRVREAGCATFNTGLVADVIEIRDWLLSISWDEYLDCLIRIGKVVIGSAYEITKEKQDLLLDFFKQRSQGPLTRRKKNYTLNKDIKIS